MPKLKETVIVDRPIDEAFAYTAQFDNIRDWDPGVAAATARSTEPVGVGSIFDLDFKMAGRIVPLVYTVVTYDEPNQIVLEAKGGPLFAIDTISFRDVGEGRTEVTYEADLQFSGLLGLATPFMGGRLKKIGQEAVEGLAKALNRTSA